MSKLLVVEDEAITSDLLRRYFEIVGYDVNNALTGSKAVEIAEQIQPDVVILDIGLPDIDGYEVCRRLRANEKTNQIPIIFLTQKGERSDRLSGLELGADDYITKPFNVEELRLKVHNIIDRMGGIPLVDARTSLPSKSLIKERLPQILEDPESEFLHVTIDNLAEFGEKYGPVALNQVVRSTARIIGDVLQTVEPTRSFIGHPQEDRFLIGTTQKALKEVKEQLPSRFSDKVKAFYDYPDQEKGKMDVNGKAIAFMSLQIETVSDGEVRTEYMPPEQSKHKTSVKEKQEGVQSTAKVISTPSEKVELKHAKPDAEKKESVKTADKPKAAKTKTTGAKKAVSADTGKKIAKSTLSKVEKTKPSAESKEMPAKKDDAEKPDKDKGKS